MYTALVIIALALALALGQEPVRPSFSEWLAGVRAEAIARGVREEIVDAALADVTEPLPIILERDRAQAETILPLEKYIARSLTPKLITAGRDAFATHRELLDQISERYGVPSRIIVAVWGMESNFGRFIGVRPTVSALATLAWDPRRAAFFRGELLNALEILNRGDIDLPHLKGSWAGAMGQTQFMPSSYLTFAEDFDGDGRRDIWSTPADVFASIANYLKGHGWAANQSWGREVKVTPEAARRIARDVAPRNGTCQATRDMTVALPLPAGRSSACGCPAARRCPPRRPRPRSCPAPRATFSCTANYDALLDYNCAHSYAISVGLLADASAKAPPPRKRPDGRSAHSRDKPRIAPAADSPHSEAPSAIRPAAWLLRVDDRGLIVACPSCGQKNRLAYERLGDAVRCGKCKSRAGAPGRRSRSARPPTSIGWSRMPRFRSWSTTGRRGAGRAAWSRRSSKKWPRATRAGGSSSKVNTDVLTDLGERFGIRSHPPPPPPPPGRRRVRRSTSRKRRSPTCSSACSPDRTRRDRWSTNTSRASRRSIGRGRRCTA